MPSPQVACAEVGWVVGVQCVTLRAYNRCVVFAFDLKTVHRTKGRPYLFLFVSTGNVELEQQHLTCRVQGKDATNQNSY